MIFDPYLDWLGLKIRRPAVGVHVTSTHVTVVALRRRPIRLVAISRRAIPDGAVVDNEIRRVKPVVDILRLAMVNARIAPGSQTFAAIEPLADSISVDPDRSAATCDVADHAYDRIAALITGAGLNLQLIEPVPAAAARIGARAGIPAVAVDAQAGWVVVRGVGGLEAQRLSGQPGQVGQATLRLGSEVSNMAAAGAVPGLDVPTELRSLHDPGRDAVAIGAAMAAFDGRSQIYPQLTARPVALAVGSGWTVQQIDRPNSVYGKEGP